MSAYARSLTEARKFNHLAQKHTDDLLTWAAWLMGAGLLALPAAFKDRCTGRKVDLLWIPIPWAAGLMFAYLGRMVVAALREAHATYYGKKWSGVQALLLGDPTTAEELGNKLSEQMADRTPQLAALAGKFHRLGEWANAFYVLPAICFALGVAFVLWALGRC
jgi:hypothetical protein